MPADHRFRLHDHKVLSPVREELSREHPEDAVFILEHRAPGAPQQDVELVACNNSAMGKLGRMSISHEPGRDRVVEDWAAKVQESWVRRAGWLLR